MKYIKLVVQSIIVLTCVALIAVQLSACSVTFGVDWHGETAKDDRAYTAKKAN